MKTFVRKWWWVALSIPAVVILGFLIWALNPLGPMPEALEALESNQMVNVQTQPWLIFTPVESNPDIGFIIYPGGRVDYRSYAPTANALASQGYLVIIPKMPLNLAVLAPSRAEEIISAYPEIRTWAIGGHSLGGAMAANFAKSATNEIDGLILWASYPASSDDLSNIDMEVSSIYGTKDGIATSDQVLGAARILPSNTEWVAIDGGNHAQFGWYGDQPGDNPATIGRSEQQSQLVFASLRLLHKLNGIQK